VRLPATPHHLAGLSAVLHLLAEAPRVAGQAGVPFDISKRSPMSQEK